MQLQIHHQTRYRYSGEVSLGLHRVLTFPRISRRVGVREFALRTAPESVQRWKRDRDGNEVVVCDFGSSTVRELLFDVSMHIIRDDYNPFDFLLDSGFLKVPFTYETQDRGALLPLMEHSESGKAALHFLREEAGLGPRGETVPYLTALNQAVFEAFTYRRRDEAGIQSVETTIESRTGSCRDLALVFLAAIRELGIAGRYVGGYLYDPPEAEEHFNRAVGSMHAWVEAYLPGAGWKGFDPTNGILANGYFIPTAVSRDPEATTPIQGAYYSQHPETSAIEVSLEITDLAYPA